MRLGQGTTGCSGECCFGVMYCKWYGVCDFVALSPAVVCADYGGVNVFHFVLIWRRLWCWGLCNICGVVCVVCFLHLGVVCCAVM